MTSDKWATISKTVAKHFWGATNQRLSKGDHWRWGNKGSKSLKADTGRWYDFENDRGGGVMDLVEIELSTDRKGAIQWMREKGLIPESAKSSPRCNPGRSKARSGRPTQHHGAGGERKRTPTKRKPDNEKSTNQNFARTLWAESEPIGASAEHPFRAWARNRNLLHPYSNVPAGIRWHVYKGGVIVAGVFPIEAWGSDGIPSGDPVAVQCLAIDERGENRYCLGPNKDLRRCSYGEVSAGVFLLGNKESERVNIVEGVADALAVYSRAPGAVIGTLGTSTRLANNGEVIDWLIKKETCLYPDSDQAGDIGTESLIDAIKKKSPGAVVRKPKARAYDDPGEWAQKTPFPVIERYDFDEKSGIIFDSGLPWGEADRMAIQSLSQYKP